MVPERTMEGQKQYRSSMKRSGSAGSGGSEPGENAGLDTDPEHYHILSYFMAGDTSNAQSHINGGFVTAEASSDVQSGSRKQGMSGSFGKRSGSSSSLNEPSNEPPPTPAIQFYGHSSLSQSAATTHSSGVGGGSSPGMSSARAPPLTASSSSSSLSSMAAALVSGGPMPAHSLFNASGSNRGKDSPLSPSMMHTSPLSPAAVIGPGQENLMLPPPPRFPKNTTGTNPASSQTEISAHPAHDPERKQMHMAWLQHLNSMAMRANPQQQQPQQQQQQGMQPAPALTTTTAMPGYAAASPMPPPAAAGAPLAPTPVYSLPVQMHQHQQQPSMGESEERRARRLKRNRESARQSRRRKKEHLLKLEKQVNGLHTAIETERRKQITNMEPSLVKLRQERILTAQGSQDELTGIVQNTSPNCAARRAIVNFQYNALRQWLLPKYQEFFLWLTLHPESYFMAGKEERAKNLAATQATRVSSGRVSSKQIGEEITNEFKKKQKEKEATTSGGAASPTPSNSSNDGNSNKGYITSKAFDAARMWPLLCYELSVSVDQEERILQAHKKTRQLANLADKRSQMAVATRMSANMRNGVLYQAHTADHRSQSSLLHVLSPKQTLAFLKWFTANRERCRSVLQGHQHAVERKQQEEGESLSEVCRKLERVLRIPENDVVDKKEEYLL